MENNILNNGAFEGREDTDFAGGVLPFEVRIEDSNWNKPAYLPTGEIQKGIHGDKLNCVTQSNHNSFEFQLNQMIDVGTLPIGHINWLREKGYFDDAGKINFSEKYNSILNKTAEYKGNWFYKVANDARDNGLIPQPMLLEKVNEDWDTYYNKKQITQEMLDLGKEFLTLFKISYEWVDDVSVENLVKQLQHVPLQVVFPRHAVVEIKSKENLMNYYDSYNPYVKEKAQNKITSYMKLVIDPIINLPEDIKIIKDANSKSVGIWYGCKNEEELVTKATEAGFPIPRNSDGTLNWDILIQGLLTLNKNNMISETIKGWLGKKKSEETRVEEAPVEETPVEEVPVEEAPVEDAPVEDAPVEEHVPSFL